MLRPFFPRPERTRHPSKTRPRNLAKPVGKILLFAGAIAALVRCSLQATDCADAASHELQRFFGSRGPSVPQHASAPLPPLDAPVSDLPDAPTIVDIAPATYAALAHSECKKSPPLYDTPNLQKLIANAM